MDWYDVEDILYSGSKDDIQKLVCPECGESISYSFNEDPVVFKVFCKECGYLSRNSGGPKPNCVKFFGSEYIIRK